MKKKITSIILTTLILSSCETGQNGVVTRQNAATLLGAVGGGVLGSNVGKGKGRLVGSAVGALAGAAFGNWMGANLDPKDQQMHYETTNRTLESAKTGQQYGWSDPDTGAEGYIVPVRTYKSSHQVCREYEQTVIIDGRRQTATGNACRTSNGSWEIKN